MRSSVFCGTTKMTPSKPRSVSPCWTESARPPITETITTSAVVPSTMPTSVRPERSLCARISAREVRTASVTYTLLVPQGFDRVEAGGADRGVEAEEDSPRHGERQAEQHDLRRQHHRLLDHPAHRGGEAHPEPEPEQAAEDRDNDALHQELRHDVEPRRAERLARGHLAHALVEGREQDVHDHDPAHQQRDGAAGEEGDVVDPALLLLLAH